MLKSNTYITILELADWLDVPEKKVGGTGTAASKVIQDLTYTADAVGTPGNDIMVEYLSGGTAGSEVVAVNENLIQITIQSGVSTAAQIKSKVDADEDAAELVNVTISGNGSNAQTTSAAQALTGGAYSADYSARLVRILEDILNAATAKVESIIKTSVLAKEFQEDHDGNSSNVIVPQHWPVTQILDIRIDVLRQFPSDTQLDPINYFLRGQADKRQASTDVELRVVGNDIVLRDDNERYILGRIFSGSSLGAVRIQYMAGWALDAEDVPSDIRLATLQLAEFYYLQRDAKDINISSKSVKGESYSKMKDAIPEQIVDLLSPYEDMSMGSHSVPQRNTFKI